MEQKRIRLITFILVIIIVLAIGIGLGYVIPKNIPNEQTEKEVNNEEVVTQIETDKNIEVSNVETNTILNTSIESSVEENITTENTNINRHRVLNQSELDLFEQYLNSNGIWNFIYRPYNDLTEFPLEEFLRYYRWDAVATDEEIKEIYGRFDDAITMTPTKLYWKDRIDNIFKQFTGKDVSIIKQELLPDYSEKYHCYYNGTSDADFLKIEVISGTEYNNQYVIKYIPNPIYHGEEKSFEVTLKKVDEIYLFVSNVVIE